MEVKNDENIIYTMKEVSKLLHISIGYTYKLVNKGLLPAIKLGSLKVRKETLINFLKKYEGYDLSDVSNIVLLHSKKD